MSHLVKPLVLLAGDLLVLYASLLATLLLRYGDAWYAEFAERHAGPFSIIFAIWILVFYISGLYDLRRLRNNLEFLKTLALATATNAVLAIAFFYLVPVFGIAPRRNLFIFIVAFGIIEFLWRRWFNQTSASAMSVSRVVIIGNGRVSEELAGFLKNNPQLGYAVEAWFREGGLPAELNEIEGWKKLMRERSVDILVVPPHLKKESRLKKMFYQLLTLGVEVRDLPSFYETVFRKVPLSEIDEEWFLETMTGRRFYDNLKRAAELLVAVILGIALLPLELLIAFIVKLSSPGSAIYSQARVGQGGEEFILYKFRTMRTDAERDGAKWAEAGDARVTPFGKFLRYTHLDELPQLINIVKGNLSFVGPRPERPEFVSTLAEEIPYYDIRHLVKPGLTGWAQVNFRYGASVKDAYEKLQYDIYYLKNRSIVLDLAIAAKTLKSLFVTQK